MRIPLQAVVISMANAHARRERISKHFVNAPFPWRFEDASDGSAESPAYDPELTRRRMGRELKKAEIGCFQSNVKALRDFAASGEGYLLMCEDDVLIDFEFDFQAILAAMSQAGVDYMRLYSRRIAPASHLLFWRNRWLIRYYWEPFGTQCYLISVAGARRLAERLDRISRPIDDELDRYWENGFPLYSLFPHPVLELSSPSSIIRAPGGERRLDVYRYKLRRVIDRCLAVLAHRRFRQLDRRFVAALREVERAAAQA